MLGLFNDKIQKDISNKNFRSVAPGILVKRALARQGKYGSWSSYSKKQDIFGLGGTRSFSQIFVQHTASFK